MGDLWFINNITDLIIDALFEMTCNFWSLKDLCCGEFDSDKPEFAKTILRVDSKGAQSVEFGPDCH